LAQSGIYNSSDDAAVARMRDAIANGSDCISNTCLYQPGVVGALVDVSEAMRRGDKCARTHTQHIQTHIGLWLLLHNLRKRAVHGCVLDT
jgi:hypothetical protein